MSSTILLVWYACGWVNVGLLAVWNNGVTRKNLYSCFIGSPLFTLDLIVSRVDRTQDKVLWRKPPRFIFSLHTPDITLWQGKDKNDD